MLSLVRCPFFSLRSLFAGVALLGHNLCKCAAHLVGATGGLEAALDAAERRADLGCGATLDESADALEVAVAAAEDFRMADNAVVVYVYLEEFATDALGLIFVCHGRCVVFVCGKFNPFVSIKYGKRPSTTLGLTAFKFYLTTYKGVQLKCGCAEFGFSVDGLDGCVVVQVVGHYGFGC